MSSHTIRGKALLVIDAGADLNGKRAYSTEAFVQTASGLTPEAIAMAADEFGMLDGRTYDVPTQCRKMKDGDRWRIAVTFEVTYAKVYHHGSGADEWDVELTLSKAKTLRKQPWSDKRHRRYVAKSSRQ